MSKHERMINEAKQNLIVISDHLFSIYRKIPIDARVPVHEGLARISEAVEDFKVAIEVIQRQRYEELLKQDEDEENKRS